MNSTEKVLWLLKRLGNPPYSMSLTALSEELSCGRSGIYKLLSSLVKDGFAVQDQEDKKYSLGPAVYRLGMLYSDLKDISRIAQPAMHSLAEETGETVSLAVREGDDAILLSQVESPHAIRLLGKAGQKYPFNAGAIGKLLAAYHNPQRMEELISNTVLVKVNPNTITDYSQLFEEYRKIRLQGYAHSNEENTLGAFGISAPILERPGVVSACLCIAGPKERFTPERIQSWTHSVIHSAQEISKLLIGKAGG